MTELNIEILIGKCADIQQYGRIKGSLKFPGAEPVKMVSGGVRFPRMTIHRIHAISWKKMKILEHN